MPDTCLTPIQHNNGTCLTHQPHKDDTIKCGSEGEGDCFGVVLLACNGVELGCAISFDFSVFKGCCESQIAKGMSLCVKRKTSPPLGFPKDWGIAQ
ncbi:hypothetical protein CLV99_4192 [Sphingobacterium yanglingense]|uniref:Uncharacterized protein n=1 Tax=Sphingobacterium yanglingense TaxID=1437280 RepID=A0A4R6WA67_9SPHI|nr:hypothetical protein CLV99_4192 [Sphingobacterium yanglingense]